MFAKLFTALLGGDIRAIRASGLSLPVLNILP
jgi:hypothetical protein